MTTPDVVAQNIERIAALFPHCVVEADHAPSGKDAACDVSTKKIDFDLLRQELSAVIVDGPKERYRLEWPGKREAIVTANMPTTNTLRPVRDDSVNFDTTENLYIEGDNLEVLKLLQESYLGKVKMIYIDPPYNTGNDFVYNDKFAKDAETSNLESGLTDEAGNRLVSKNPLQPNPESAGRYHSDWLTMMYPRLKLARNLLTDDGVIFISIDDNEVHNLRKMCDEVFGEVNFISELIWQRAFSPKNDAKFFSNSHDYILAYAKSIDFCSIERLDRTDEANEKYKNQDNDIRGIWTSGDLSVKSYSEKYDYQITTPSGRIVTPPHGACWRVSKEKFSELCADNRIWFGVNGDNVPRLKRFLSDVQDGMVPTSIWFHKEVGHNQEGRQEVKALFDDKGYFDGPKPVRLLSRILQVAGVKKNDIVLDFFSGSATTAHAVMQLNAEDGGKRKFIMVQLPETTDEKSEAYKAGYKNICEIGKERIRRAGKQIAAPQPPKGGAESANADLFSAESNTKHETQNTEHETQNTKRTTDIGFRVYRLDSSNMQDVYYRPQDYRQETINLFANHIKSDRTADDLVAQVMLDWGLELSLPIEKTKIAGKIVYKVDGNALYCCFDEGIDEAFVRSLVDTGHTPSDNETPHATSLRPIRIVFHDHSFATDTAKENVRQLLKQLSAETEMKVV
ncbi:MAG: site-specific DNA-methyltransferase [Paludibacter sp.]|nr:site-specific DNA-methyltransferase [Paludibacter sp.]